MPNQDEPDKRITRQDDKATIIELPQQAITNSVLKNIPENN